MLVLSWGGKIMLGAFEHEIIFIVGWIETAFYILSLVNIKLKQNWGDSCM